MTSVRHGRLAPFSSRLTYNAKFSPGNLRRLRELWLHSNCLETVPDSFGKQDASVASMWLPASDCGCHPSPHPLFPQASSSLFVS